MSERADDSRGVGWTSRVLVFAILMLMCLNARSPSAWLSMQPPTSRIARLQPIADDWWRTMGSLGLDWPRATIAALWSRAETSPWPAFDQRPRPTEEPHRSGDHRGP